MDIRGMLGLRESGFTARKTVTFGDESAVTANRLASILSVVAIFFFWGMFTGSVISPIHMPAPFMGESSFTYTASDGTNSGQARVDVVIHERGAKVKVPKIETDASALVTGTSLLVDGGWTAD